VAVITKTQLENASRDADDLSLIVNGAADRSNPGQANGTVTTRLGQVVRTVAKVIVDIAASNVGDGAAALINQKIENTGFHAGPISERGPTPFQDYQNGLHWFVTNLSPPRLFTYITAGNTDPAGVVMTANTWFGYYTQAEIKNLAIGFTGLLPQANVAGLPDVFALYDSRVLDVNVSDFRARALTNDSPIPVQLDWTARGALDRFELSWANYTVTLGGGVRSFRPPVWATQTAVTSIGDSMMEGKWVEGAAAALGLTLNNVAKYSSGAYQAYRLGTRQLLFTVTGNTIPASGTGVQVTAINGGAPTFDNTDDPFSGRHFLNTSPGDSIATNCSVSGWYGGRHGTVSVPNGGTLSYTFTPDDGQAASAVVAQSIFVPDNLARLATDELWIRLSQNYWYADYTPVFPNNVNPRVFEDIQAIVDRARGQRIIILALTPGADMGPATSKIGVALRYFNNQLRVRWPQYAAYVTNLNVNGTNFTGNNMDYIRAFGSDGSANDVADIANGLLPRSCLASADPSEVHLNAKGQALESAFLVAYRIVQKAPPLLALGTLLNIKALGTNLRLGTTSEATTSTTVVNSVEAATLTNLKNTKADLVPPLKPTTYVNAVRNRFSPSAFAGAIVPAASGSAPVLAVTFEQAAYDNSGQLAVIRMSDTVAAAATQPRFTIPITVADLALTGLVPSDSAPPKFSARAAIQRATLLNQTIDNSQSINGIWYVVARYNGANASLAGPLDAANDVAFVGAQAPPASIGQGQADSVWAGSTGSYVLTADEKILLRNNVPLRATYNGKALSGLILMFFGQAPAAGPTAFSVARVAVVPGATIDQNASYRNTPEDSLSYVGIGSLAPSLAAQIAGAATEASVATRIANTLAAAIVAARAPSQRHPINRLALDVDYATSLDMRTVGYTLVDLAAQTDLVERGYTKGIQWNNGNNYARWQSGTSQAGKYVFGCMLLYSVNPANLPDVTTLNDTNRATLYSAATDGTLAQVTAATTYGGIKISDRCILLWCMGQVGAGVTNPNLLVGRPLAPTENTTLFATGFTIATSDTAFEVDGTSLAWGTMLQDYTRREIMLRVDKKVASGATTTYTSYPNAFAYGDYFGGTPNLRSNSAPVNLASTNPLYKMGFRRGFNAKTPNPAGGTNEYFRLATGADISNKYFVAIFMVQSDTPSAVPVPIQQFLENTTPALSAISGTSGSISLGNGTYLQWMACHPGTLTNTQNYLFGINGLPAADTYVTGAYAYMSDTLPDSTAVIAAYRYRLAVMQDAMARILDATSGTVDTGRALLVLGGEGYGVRSYVESNLADFKLRRAFDPFNTITAPANPGRVRWLFNPREDIINGVTVRAPGDDATPDHIYGTTLGANHGYTTGELAVAGHDKTTADVGSVWSTGGAQYTLVGIKDANTLILTRRTDNAAVPSGTFAYVSGGTHTAGFTSTASVAGQWYPPAQDATMRVLVDGQQVCVAKNGALVSGSYSGSYYYRDTVQFIETYDVLPKSELVAWVEANGAAAIYPTGRAGSLRVTNVWEYDRYAQMTVQRDWLFLQSVDVQDLMGLQLELLGAITPSSTAYYIPNTKAFTYNGNTVNYALNPQRGDLTINASGQPSVFFDASNIEAAGPYMERALLLYDGGYVDAAGFLPIADVTPAVRKTRVSTRAFEIRGNTGKRYFRVLDRGSFTAVAGDHYSAVGYRHVFPKSAQRTAYYTVRNREADYIYLDWHNFAGLDTVQLSEEMIGRGFTVYASRNATVKGDILAGCLSASVAATGDYAFLILRVQK
jgi:hypothetical protein